MPTRNDRFPSKYLSAADLHGETVATIDRVVEELVGVERKAKAVAYFREPLKPYPFNVTNWDSVAALSGRKHDRDWAGVQVRLVPTKVTFKNEVHDSIRIAPPLALRQPVPPITWLPFSVHDGDNEDVVSLDCVEHGVRKHAHSTDSDILFKNSPTFRSSDDAGDGRPNFVGKSLAQRASAWPIKLDGLLEFRSRFGMKRVPHLASRRSMRRYTSAAGTGFTSPHSRSISTP